MKKIIRVILIISLFVIYTPFGRGFRDVGKEVKYSPAIDALEERGILQGEIFEPEKPVSRQEFAKWLLKNSGFFGENYKPKTLKRFIDVRYKGNPNAPYIYRLADLGVIDMPGKRKFSYFRPNDPMPKTEAIEWIFNIEGIPIPKIFEEADFGASDVKFDDKTAPLINKAIQLGLLNEGKIYPKNKLKRGQAAHFLWATKQNAPTLTVTLVPSQDSDLVRNPKYDILVGAWNKIMRDFLRRDQIKKEDVVYGAIEGMVKELGDKHTNFERPGDNALLDSLSGEVEGIGAVIQMKDDEVVVVAPLDDSPAAKAGIEPNDVILKVDDADVKGMTLTQVVSRIKGKKGTIVKLTVRRKKKIIEFEITRDIVTIISAKASWTDDNIAIIDISNFGDHTEGELRIIADQVAARKPKGLVLDVRNNPGGFLDMAIKVSGFFVEKGKKIASVRYPDREEPYISSGTAELAKYPIVLIVNSGSASAAEIFAGALKDYKLAKIVGVTTYGKGTVQELSDFSDGSTLKLTVAEWLTPSGHLIEKNGIAPDIEVKITDEDRAAKRDPQMERALMELRK